MLATAANSPNSVTRYFNQVVGPGQTLPVQAAGTQFYLTAASGPLFIKPSHGSFCLYYSAMGDVVPAGFSQLSVYNPTKNAITFGLVVSSSTVIDKRQLPSTQTPTVMKVPTLPAPSGSAINATGVLPDFSGLQFNDPAGTPWLAIKRIAIYAQLILPGAGTFLALFSGLTVPGTPTFFNSNMILSLYAGPDMGSTLPATVAAAAPLVFECAGDFCFYISTFSKNDQVCASIYELYQAVAPNSQALQPPN